MVCDAAEPVFCARWAPARMLLECRSGVIVDAPASDRAIADLFGGIQVCATSALSTLVSL